MGNGLNVTAAYGDANINTKVGDGVSVNVAWGKYNINTKVGDGLNVAVMKGKANANIHVGDGLNINASYAQNNVAIKVGNGDFYSLAVASSNTSSNKLSALFDNIKQTVLGVGGSQAINYLVQGDEPPHPARIKVVVRLLHLKSPNWMVSKWMPLRKSVLTSVIVSRAA